MKHAHWSFSESRPQHVLNLAYGSELSTLTRLVKLDLTSKESPVDLRNELILGCLQLREDFLEMEEILVCLLVFLEFEELFGIGKQV